MRPSDRYVAFSPSSLQSMFADCAAVTKLCGNVAKLLADSTAISLETGPRGIISYRPSFLGPCAQSSSQRSALAERSVSAIS
jgi:hypothetical protein